MSTPDLEALVTPRIADAFQAAVGKIGRQEFQKLAGIDDQSLTSILTSSEGYVAVGLVTLACNVNKAHNDPNLFHSSVTECLKGSTIRIPPSGRRAELTPRASPSARDGRAFRRLKAPPSTSGFVDQKSVRILGFVANIAGFLVLGYFLGGIAISPLIGESSCIGVASSPPSLSPCGGSLVGIVLGVVGGIAYTFYYFVKRV